MIAKARQNILNKISRILGEDISKTHPVWKATPQLIQDKTYSYKGSLYGTSSNSRFAAFFRHKNFSSQYKNLIFAVAVYYQVEESRWLSSTKSLRN
jgi:hypothetical protein